MPQLVIPPIDAITFSGGFVTAHQRRNMLKQFETEQQQPEVTTIIQLHHQQDQKKRGRPKSKSEIVPILPTCDAEVRREENIRRNKAFMCQLGICFSIYF